MKKEGILKEYTKGYSIRSLSKKYGCPRSTLRYHLVKNNILRLNKKPEIIKKVKKHNHLMIGTLIGLWAGDGSKFKDRWCYIIKIHLHKNDKGLANMIKRLLHTIFDKNSRFVSEKTNNKAVVITISKFIYEFIDKYVVYGKNKTLTVKLRNDTFSYSKRFLKGFLLGITLSDGYIKERFVLNVISHPLIMNVYGIFTKLGYHPRIACQNRRKYGWHNLYSISLSRKETVKLKNLLNQTLRNLGIEDNLDLIKNYQ